MGRAVNVGQAVSGTALGVGKIVKYDRGRGYGFIEPEDGSEDVFVHARDLNGTEEAVLLGSRVRYSVVPGDRGKRAADVHVLGRPDDDTAVQRASGATDGEDDVDVVAVGRYEREITDLLLSVVPSITGAEIVEIRDRLIRAARQRRWIE